MPADEPYEIIRERNELERHAIALGERWQALGMPLDALRPISFEASEMPIFRVSGG